MARNNSKGTQLSEVDIASTFYGTLRSELDETEKLPDVLAPTLEAFLDLQKRYEDGELDEHEIVEELAKLVYVDQEGDEWTMGASSQRWYRRRHGGRWMPTPPDLIAVA